MTTFRVPVLDRANGAFEVWEQELPAVPADGLLVRVEYSGVCATDLHISMGHLPNFHFPSTLGHEVCGIVEQVGAEFGTDVRGVKLKPGDRVAVMPATPCGTCASCKQDSRYQNCERPDVIGMSDPNQRIAGGGFGQYVLCNGRARVFVSIAPVENVVLTEPAATPIEGLSRAGFQFGDTVLVQGTGALGLLAIAAAAQGGARKVVAIGGPARRLELARDLGAEVTIGIADFPDAEQRRDAVLAASPEGNGYDIVIECTGVLSTVPEGLSYLTRGSCFIELGHFSDVGSVEINPYKHILSRDARIVSSSGYSPDSYGRALTLVENLGDMASRLITHRLPLDRVGDALNALRPENRWQIDGVEVGKIVIDPWAEESAR